MDGVLRRQGRRLVDERGRQHGAAHAAQSAAHWLPLHRVNLLQHLLQHVNILHLSSPADLHALLQAMTKPNGLHSLPVL